MTDLPPTADPTIDADAAGKLLRRIEAHHDMGGWHAHGNMWVYVIHDHHDVVTAALIRKAMGVMGEPVRNSRYTAQPMLRPEVFDAVRHPDDDKPTATLRRFAFNLAFADSDHGGEEFGGHLRSFRDLLAQPGLLGFAACFEAYGHRNNGAGPLRAVRADPTKHLGDLAGAEEVRTVLMVDALDRRHSVTRWRDGPAELMLDMEFQGDVTTSLRMLMDTAMRRTPTDQAGYNARYRPLDDILDDTRFN